MGMTVMKNEVYTHRPLETGGTSHCSGLRGEALGSVWRQRCKGKAWAKAFIVLFVDRKR